jgi:hypothetical protein
MTDNNKVLDKIKSTFKEESSETRNLKLPGNIDFIVQGNNVIMLLSADAVCKNMQEDKASFEGWALVLKRWGNYTNVILRWNRPIYQTNTTKEGHYQRFLFRLDCFKNHFKEWFNIDCSCVEFMNELKTKKPWLFFLNKPSKNRTDHKPQNEEGRWEQKFVEGELKSKLIDKTNAAFIDRQLPVGIFKDEVSINNAIFSRGKSAIDIWGISKANELMIFELKAEHNDKVGIISEIYFYANVMRMVKTGKFEYQKPCKVNLERISDVSKIKAYILAPSLHPLIDEKIMEIMNTNVLPEMEFHYINYDKTKNSITHVF